MALLNIRSITAEFPDIGQDNVVKSAHVVCISETWLTQNQTSPCIPDHQVIARSGHITGNVKRGVMITVNSAIQMTNVTNFPFNNILIEATTATLTLPNNKQLQVTVVYRSPSVPMSVLFCYV